MSINRSIKGWGDVSFDTAADVVSAEKIKSSVCFSICIITKVRSRRFARVLLLTRTGELRDELKNVVWELKKFRPRTTKARVTFCTSDEEL